MTTLIHHTARPLGTVRAQLGEGPVWDAENERLIWIDILGQRVHLANADGAAIAEWPLDEQPGTAAPAGGGGVLVATTNGLRQLDADGVELWRGSELAGAPGHRFNDGKLDPSGRLIVGTLALDDASESAALYRWDRASGLESLLDGVSLSNGLGWSPDGSTFYYVDTPTGRVDAFDVDPDTAALSARREFARIPTERGLPDGLCVDDTGVVWVALWGGSAVLGFGPDGAQIAEIAVAATNVTSCGFGGTDRRRLFITTATVDCDAADLAARPHSGGLFCVDLDRTGPVSPTWRDSGGVEAPGA